MKIAMGKLRTLIRTLVEGTIEVHPKGLQPGDVLNGRTISDVSEDPTNDSYVFVTFNDGSQVRLKARNIMNKHVPRVDRPGESSDPNLQKIPAGWGKKKV